MLQRKKKIKKIYTIGIINITNTFNNTLINITDLLGNTLSWVSAGILGFKNTKKKTPYAAQCVARNIVLKLNEFGIKNLNINFKGCGKGRDICLRTFSLNEFNILSIQDKTPQVHNGCRPKKKRKL